MPTKKRSTKPKPVGDFSPEVEEFHDELKAVQTVIRRAIKALDESRKLDNAEEIARLVVDSQKHLTCASQQIKKTIRRRPVVFEEIHRN